MKAFLNIKSSMGVQFDGNDSRLGKVSISRILEIKEEEMKGNNFADVIVWRREIISSQGSGEGLWRCGLIGFDIELPRLIFSRSKTKPYQFYRTFRINFYILHIFLHITYISITLVSSWINSQNGWQIH